MKGKQVLRATGLIIVIVLAAWRVVGLEKAEREKKEALALEVTPLEIGEQAPEFVLKQRKTKKKVSLAALQRKGDTLLWFYAPG